mmetsp:Transcript_5540/g.12759  ORF Transcript_5540/g.12759 Transcript_5540/m.12759 type:complete len:219 (-) Transcript_5540:1743-2399(-)
MARWSLNCKRAATSTLLRELARTEAASSVNRLSVTARSSAMAYSTCTTWRFSSSTWWAASKISYPKIRVRSPPACKAEQICTAAATTAYLCGITKQPTKPILLTPTAGPTNLNRPAAAGVVWWSDRQGRVRARSSCTHGCGWRSPAKARGISSRWVKCTSRPSCRLRAFCGPTTSRGRPGCWTTCTHGMASSQRCGMRCRRATRTTASTREAARAGAR